MTLNEFIFRERGPDITSSEIKELEVRLNIVLPQDYKDFLLKFNGGLSKLCVSEDPPFRIKTWFCVCKVEKLPRIVSIEKVMDRLSPDLSSDFLPIGEDVANRVAVMGVSGNRKMRVGIWDPEMPETKAFDLPFASFTDLLNHLQNSNEFV